jgi:hypothetical protein
MHGKSEQLLSCAQNYTLCNFLDEKSDNYDIHSRSELKKTAHIFLSPNFRRGLILWTLKKTNSFLDFGRHI